ncbi:hypothetical protein [Emticicia sp. TH156]|uniref:hypothetical protein n=1 Tax=Emticicia sp. TH156 TaxID=2067454 RepID=UPI000C76929B|nr:hypothetical protein [Emticicia sp. TH156]PLK44209.1 hypothetical protein C0V77_10430 [Emticicia sp. TH156]
MKLLFCKLILIIFFVSCNYKRDDNASYISKTNEDEILELPINLKNSPNKQMAIRKWLNENYFRINADIKIEEIDDSVNLLSIFKISFNGGHAYSFNNFYSLIYFKKDNKSYLIPIEYLQSYKINGIHMLGGVYSKREFEYYLIYALKDNILEIILDSRKQGKYGLKIGYFRDDDCIVYKPNRFLYNFDNKNNTIKFTGTILDYCKPNFDRDTSQKKPIKSKDITIEYIFTGTQWMYSGKSDYIFW